MTKADYSNPDTSCLREVTSSVSSMEISEPTSEPISDTTADSVRSDPSDTDARNISPGTNDTPSKATNTVKAIEVNEYTKDTLVSNIQCM